MEKRIAKVNISSAGGTAAKGAKTYKVTLPTSWMNAMYIGEARRELELSFDGKQIVLSRHLTDDEFASWKSTKGHDVLQLQFFDGDTLCTTIYADYTDKTLMARNHISDPVKMAFGNNALPTWEDFQAFLEERCIPRQRAGLKEYLDAIGVSEYEPIEIILKTSGRMAEDNQWLTIRNG